jgi:PAS domain S-box-containing protein
MLGAKRLLLSGYSVAVIVSLLTVLLRLLLTPLLQENAPLLLFILPVLFSAWYGGSRPGLLATAICTSLGTYFFVPPQLSLQLADIAELTRVVIFVLEGVCISGLSGALRRAKNRAEQVAVRLRESEEQYRLLVEEVKDYAIFGLDPQGRITSWNSGAEVIKGYTAAEALGRHFSMFYPESDVAAGRPERNLHIAASEGRVEDEGWRRRKDGSLFWANVVITALRDEHGELRGFSKVVRDITQQKRNEGALQESYGLLQTVIEGTGDAIFVKDQQGRYKLANSATARIFGKSKAEILGKDDTELLPLDVAAYLQQIDRTVMQTGMSQTFEEEILEADGIHAFLTTKDPYRDAQGQITGVIGVARDITELKQIEANLREQEQLFRSTFNQAAVGIAHVSPTGQWLRVNQKLCEIVGYTHDELLQRTFQDITYAEDLEIDLAYVRQMLAGEIQTYRIEKRYIRKDGSLIWISLTVSLVREATGQPKYFIAVVEDISARKQAEADLQRSEERFRTALFNAPLPTFVCTEDGEVLQVNRVWTEISGYSIREIPTLNDWLQRAYGDRGNEVLAEILRIYPLERPRAMGEYTINTAMETNRIWDIYASPLGEVDGKRLVVVMAIDVTERKQAEADLQKYKDIFQFAEHGLAISRGSVLERVNPAFARMHGYTVEELTGYPILNLFPPDTRAETIEFIQQLNVAGHLMHESVHLRKDGTAFPVLLDITLVPDEPNLPYRIVNLFDITERKQAEEALQQLNATLEQRVAERTAQLEETNQELEAFTYSVSHDLRAPLRTMQGFAQALLEDCGEQLEDFCRIYVDSIIGDAIQMNELITDLLNYSHLTRAQISLTPIALEEVIEEALKQLTAQIAEKQAQIRVAAPLPQVMAHRSTLIQVIANLISNAIKFTAPNTRPEIDIFATIERQDKQQQIRLWIVDNGIGIAPEHQERIFRVFERLHGNEIYPGTGIGLAIVRKGLERMGGRVGMESQLGQGSRFWIALPSAVLTHDKLPYDPTSPNSSD